MLARAPRSTCPGRTPAPPRTCGSGQVCRLAPACRRASRHERWRAVPGWRAPTVIHGEVPEGWRAPTVTHGKVPEGCRAPTDSPCRGVACPFGDFIERPPTEGVPLRSSRGKAPEDGVPLRLILELLPKVGALGGAPPRDLSGQRGV